MCALSRFLFTYLSLPHPAPPPNQSTPPFWGWGELHEWAWINLCNLRAKHAGPVLGRIRNYSARLAQKSKSGLNGSIYQDMHVLIALNNIHGCTCTKSISISWQHKNSYLFLCLLTRDSSISLGVLLNKKHNSKFNLKHKLSLHCLRVWLKMRKMIYRNHFSVFDYH